MIAALSLSSWRARGRRRVCAALAAFALGFHLLAMAVHRPAWAVPAPVPAAADHADCHDDASAAPEHDGGVPHRHRMPPCPICQSLQAAVPPPHAPAIVGSVWTFVLLLPPPALAPPPRLVLTDLNPRGPPVLG